MSHEEDLKIAWSNFEREGWRSAGWAAFRMALFENAHRLLCKMGKQKLVDLAEQLGRSPKWIPGLPEHPAERHDFATDACIKQMTKFDERIKSGSPKAWCPGRGASALTYFVNGVLLDLPNLAKKWQNDHRHQTREAPVECPGEHLGDCDAANPYDDVEHRRFRDDVLRKAPPQVAEGLRYRELGWSEKETAAALSISVGKLRRDRESFFQQFRNERGIS